jgi:hypothetical protein
MIFSHVTTGFGRIPREKFTKDDFNFSASALRPPYRSRACAAYPPEYLTVEQANAYRIELDRLITRAAGR